MRKHCITFAPFLKNINGHSTDYHLSLNRIFQEKKWKVATFVQELCEIDHLPDNWVKNLYEPSSWSRRSVIAKTCPFLINRKSLLRTKFSYLEALKNYISNYPEAELTLLFETFNTFHLYILSQILPDLPRGRFSILFIYRYDQKQLFFEGRLDKKLLNKLEKQVGKKRVSVFADTDFLVQNLSTFFNRKISLLPIPHTEEASGFYTEPKKSPKKLVFWWPGSPRSPKGLNVIQKLLHSEELKEGKWFLKLSENTPGLPTQKSKGVILLPLLLSRKQYIEHLSSSDVVLLPYSKWNYEYSSSGIFIEAVCAGVLPAVSEGLWISKELKRFGLGCLIFDFKDLSVLSKIEEISKDDTVWEKLFQMREAYQSYHNEKSFKEELFKAFFYN